MTVNFFLRYIYPVKVEMEISMNLAHENQSSPPSLSQCGEFKIDKTKADLLVCFDDLTQQNPQNSPQVILVKF